VKRLFAGLLFAGRLFAGALFRGSLLPPATPGGVFRRRGPIRRTFARPDPVRVFRRVVPWRTLRRPDAMSMPVMTADWDTNEVVDWAYDFSNFPEIVAGETIASCAVPAVSGLTIGTPEVLAAEFDGIAAGEGVKVRISSNAAVAGTTYAHECRATFSGGAVRVVKGRLEAE
jgi:hypothetical protein